MKSYVFRVELVEEDDGRWSAGRPCAARLRPWGDTREEALRNIHDAVEVYIRDMQKAGQEIAKDAVTQVIEEPVVAVTI